MDRFVMKDINVRILQLHDYLYKILCPNIFLFLSFDPISDARPVQKQILTFLQYLSSDSGLSIHFQKQSNNYRSYCPTIYIIGSIEGRANIITQFDTTFQLAPFWLANRLSGDSQNKQTVIIICFALIVHDLQLCWQRLWIAVVRLRWGVI